MPFPAPIPVHGALILHYQQLRQIIYTSVQRSFQSAQGLSVIPAGEVDLVLSWFIYGLEDIQLSFNTVLRPHGMEVDIAGIFAHQTPVVDFPRRGPKAGRCELADLCVMVTYDQPLDRLDALGNAVLLQAKMDFDSSTLTPQRDLYEQRTAYRYYRSQALTSRAPKGRTLPKKRSLALAYWELAQGLYQTPPFWPWGQQSHILPATHVRHGIGTPLGFADTLLELMLGTFGEGFLNAPMKEPWTRIIFDLLEATAKAAVNRTNLAVHRPDRASGELATRALTALTSADHPFIVRNSLPEILSHYSPELAVDGKAIESSRSLLDANAFTRFLTAKEIVRPDEPVITDDDDDSEPPKGDDGGDPPRLHNNRGTGNEDNGGGGNVVLIHFKTLSEQSRRR